MRMILSGIRYRDLIGAISGLISTEEYSVPSRSTDKDPFPWSTFLTDYISKLEDTLEDFLCGYDDEVTTELSDYNPVILEKYFELSTVIKRAIESYSQTKDFKFVYCGLDILVVEFEEQ